ncbi:MAG: hypothetical protein LCH73_13625 [Proteobacteria bacterium]|nr:hypothetical protein [Pseudomonadota bacterium]
MGESRQHEWDGFGDERRYINELGATTEYTTNELGQRVLAVRKTVGRWSEAGGRSVRNSVFEAQAAGSGHAFCRRLCNA